MIKSSFFSRFLRDKSGQFAIIFAIVVIPLLAAVGLAIDYSTAVQSSTRLRDATDAAAFFAATEYRRTGELPTNTEVLNFVSSNYNVAAGEYEPTLFDMTVVDGKLLLKTQVVRPLAIMGIFGNSDTVIDASSKVTISLDEDLEIALALDTTYSMTKASGASANQLDPTGQYLPNGTTDVDRLTALKVAALKFTDSIFGFTGGTGSRRISVVPFSRYVNVGLSQRGQPWLDVPADSASTGTACSEWYYPIVGYSSDCTQQSYLYDGVEVKYQSCAPIYGEEKVQYCWPTGESKWNGCVGSRAEPFNLKENFANKKFPGLMNVTCGTELLPLSADKLKVANRISALSAADYTYIPEGVMWGIRTLTEVAPFVEAVTPSKTKKVRKILVIMTDGENQASADLPGSPTHYGSDFAKADAWTTAACNAAKAEDIEVFSVTFGTDLSSAAKSIIRGCASKPSNYFDATSADKLIEAFEGIAAEVNRMYLAG